MHTVSQNLILHNFWRLDVDLEDLLHLLQMKFAKRTPQTVKADSLLPTNSIKV